MEKKESPKQHSSPSYNEETDTNRESVLQEEENNPDDNPSLSPDEELKDLQQQQKTLYDTIAQLEKELEQAKESVLRKAAEFDNLKKRTQKEKAAFFDEARAEAISRFLPVREDLKRSIEATDAKETNDSFFKGVKLVLENFDKTLKDYQVEIIEETGVPFDVEKHDAMLTQPPSNPSMESNTVLQIMEPGYKIGGKVIKHAKVIVSQ